MEIHEPRVMMTEVKARLDHAKTDFKALGEYLVTWDINDVKCVSLKTDVIAYEDDGAWNVDFVAFDDYDHRLVDALYPIGVRMALELALEKVDEWQETDMPFPNVEIGLWHLDTYDEGGVAHRNIGSISIR